uniref:Helicase domain-containing protein n=1 Tax=uncultured marine group II/III euryarchaeote KM3_87_B04 TaxID=1456530 RepID=A0A075HVC8_9EURY|nr:helicase domain-containing protein [uncultured marine group II/III euryarchaeote KM3_87_B04]
MEADLRVSRNEIYSHGTDRKILPKHQIVIMVVNSARTRVQELTSIGRWMLIADECHRTASLENRKALDGNWVATLGLSATPERQYDEYFIEILIPMLGEIIANYSYEQALSDDVISPFDLHNYAIPLTVEEEGKIQKFTRQILFERKRLEKINEEESPKLLRLFFARSRVSKLAHYRIPLAAKICQEYLPSKIILFHESIDQIEILSEYLNSEGYSVCVYHSRLSSRMKESNLRLFREGHFDILLTCRALDEGFNVPAADVGVIVSSTKSPRQRIQRMGRVLRKAPGKSKSIVVTIFARFERLNLENEAQEMIGISEIMWFGEN